MEAEEELAKETVRAFKAGLHGDKYDNPFTAAEEAAKGDPAPAAEEERKEK